MHNKKSRQNIRQQKFNALLAIYLHGKKIAKLRRINRFVDALSVAVPAFYLTPRLIAKGTGLSDLIDNLGEILAAILLVLAIFKLVYKWQDNEIRHLIGSRKNSDTVYEADRLLAKQTVTPEVLEQFLMRVKDVDAEDEDLLNDVREEKKQEAYVAALRKFSPTKQDAICPICGANAWDSPPGTCEACGKRPAQSGSTIIQ